MPAPRSWTSQMPTRVLALGVALGAVVGGAAYYGLSVVSDVWTEDEAWSDVARHDVKGALAFGLCMAVYIYISTIWAERPRRREGDQNDSAD